jgi:putative NADPH-quinone reductase
VLVFPVWNFGYPAILKGFFDRVFLPGVSFRLVDGRVRPNLTHIRRLAAVTTYGGTRLRAVLAGDPPRCCVTRHLWHVTRPARTRYLALYDMNRADRVRRERFLARVGREMAAL